MSLSTQTKHRLPQIKAGLLKGETYTSIGANCGVTKRTIDRDIEAWLNSGEFETWIKEEWLRLHPIILKTYPELAYKEISRLVGKMLTRKIEAHSESYSYNKTEMKVEGNVEQLLKQYEDLFEEATLLENRAPEPLHPPQAHRKTGTVPPT